MALRILSLGLETSTPTGEPMLTVMGGIAESERSTKLERRQEGIAEAKGEGKYKGRKPTARARSAEVAALKAEGRSVRAIAAALGISVGSVHGISKRSARDPTEAWEAVTLLAPDDGLRAGPNRMPLNLEGATSPGDAIFC